MITQRLVSNFDHILRSKIYFFFKRSIWKYLILALLIAYLKPMNQMHPILSAIVYFLLINVILWPLQYISAKAYARSINFDADVTFGEDEIIIKHNNKEAIETKDWNWIQKIEIRKERIWLTLTQARPFGISIPLSKLSKSDIDLFRRKMK